MILGKVCEKKNWKYCHVRLFGCLNVFIQANYNGKMSHKAREEAVEKFKDDADVKIMIASLKCGGIGLVSATP